MGIGQSLFASHRSTYLFDRFRGIGSLCFWIAVLAQCGCQSVRKPTIDDSPLNPFVNLIATSGQPKFQTNSIQLATAHQASVFQPQGSNETSGISRFPEPIRPSTESFDPIEIEEHQPESPGPLFEPLEVPGHTGIFSPVLGSSGKACHENWTATDCQPGTLRFGCYRLKHSILEDHRNFYSCSSLGVMLCGFTGGAILANTNGDTSFQNWYQRDFRSTGTDDVALIGKQFGEGKYVFPALGAAMFVGVLTLNTAPGCVVEEWGERGLRATLVGAPAMIFMQLATGASRPGETSAGSRWKPFQDNNGVSGHAFVGALPFVTAAQMTENELCKAGLYAASTWSAWSRVNDDAHYLSQIGLGWMMAYMACKAVDQSHATFLRGELLPVVINETVGVGLLYEF